MIFATDTCSLIALQYSGYLSTIAETIDIVITKKIHSELEEIGKFTDNDAAAAREILKLLHNNNHGSITKINRGRRTHRSCASEKM